MRVVIAGSSGFLGTHLISHLRSHGHQVSTLVRRAPGPDEIRWDPYAGPLDPAVVADAHVVVNLAGAPTMGNPHSKKWARELRESRVRTTAVLAEAIARSERPPAFMAGNGISFYGDHGAEPLKESALSRGDALLTDVTREWQEATAPAAAAGSRVCILRTAPVIDRRSAPLSLLAPLFKAGLGARLGSGRQYFPIISLRDWLAAVAFLVESRDLSGPFNLCAPQTPTNAEFTTALARAVHRRAFLAVPSFALRRAAGAMAPEVLGSLNTVPAALEAAGFDFADRTVDDVISTGLAA
ncbi:TIGR01777 family protein [Nocardioides sp. Y6]|uniref:TIGR01777 family protein n=1 Tax=Nocardioides malaquae TaxID=2773426 RepID=A0ABR9RWC8_9ACTN|nr:TIGR01777 family oxidoreductase [Nocardioides malaquae]MBE7325670.1 TIGR01777 family protein [Nocardioides malaquae]